MSNRYIYEQGSISTESDRSGSVLQGTSSHQCPGMSTGESFLSRAFEDSENKSYADVSSCAAEYGDVGDEQWNTNGARMVDDTAEGVGQDRNRGDISVFETGMDSQCNDGTERSERTQREAESQRVIAIAKAHHLYFVTPEWLRFGELYPKKTGESVVFLNTTADRVYKFKDPFAKSPLKCGVFAKDILYEHLVHNLIFPETALTFEGISEKLGEVRIVLSQEFVSSVQRPSVKEIERALNRKGLIKENRYGFGNEYVSVTDVEGDNVLKGIDGKIYFIDPIINFKKPVKDILANYKTDMTQDKHLSKLFKFLKRIFS